MFNSLIQKQAQSTNNYNYDKSLADAQAAKNISHKEFTLIAEDA